LLQELVWFAMTDLRITVTYHFQLETTNPSHYASNIVIMAFCMALVMDMYRSVSNRTPAFLSFYFLAIFETIGWLIGIGIDVNGTT